VDDGATQEAADAGIGSSGGTEAAGAAPVAAVPGLDEALSATRLLEQRRTRRIWQAICSVVLLLSCLAATVLIISEAMQGAVRSLYCELSPHKKAAPLVCVVPLGFTAVSCHLAVVLGLFSIARFAWRSRSSSLEGTLSENEPHRAALRSDLKAWRGISAKVLFAAGVTYLLVGAPCAGLARQAFVFLATGFLTLYATILFFDDDFEHVQARLSPRLFRFLGVYTLVGLTFTVMSAGVVDWFGGHRPDFEEHSESTTTSLQPSIHGGFLGHKFGGDGGESRDSSPMYDEACTEEGRRHLAPPSCTVPLDLVAVTSLWWAASPLFSMLVGTARREGGGCVRRLLQRWRKWLDGFILGCTGLVMLVLRNPCVHDAPVAFANAELGVWTVFFLVGVRRFLPECDGWRGPLEHLTAPPSNAPVAVVQCAVCLMDLHRGEDICRTPCGHDFHRDCLEDWVLMTRNRSPDCPLCRERLEVVDTSAENPCGMSFVGGTRIIF